MKHPSGSARAAILAAAVECATDLGWAETSLQLVRDRARVSNGTLFHYFPTRDTLTRAVVASGLANHQRVLLKVLVRAIEPSDGVVAVVVSHLRWMTQNRELARLFLTETPDNIRERVDTEAVQSNQTFFTEVGTWLQTHGWTGEPDLFVVVALWIGPAQEYSRRWLATGSSDPIPPERREALAQGAWAALKPLLRKE